MKTISKIIIGAENAASVVAHVMRSGQWIESYPSGKDCFVITVQAEHERLLPLGGDVIEGEKQTLPRGLKVYGKPSTAIEYPQCAAPEKFYLAIPVISTCHVMASDMDAFYDSKVHSCWVLRDGCGIIFWWSCDAGDEELAEDFPAYTFSDSFCHMVKSFRDLGYNYLRLDRDGDIVPGLPVFEW